MVDGCRFPPVERCGERYAVLRLWLNAASMLVHPLRRWPILKPALPRRLEMYKSYSASLIAWSITGAPRVGIRGTRLQRGEGRGGGAGKQKGKEWERNDREMESLLNLMEKDFTLKVLIIFKKTMETKGIYSIWNHYKCFSYLFLLHLNTYLMGLRPLEIFLISQCGNRL